MLQLKNCQKLKKSSIEFLEVYDNFFNKIQHIILAVSTTTNENTFLVSVVTK